MLQNLSQTPTHRLAVATHTVASALSKILESAFISVAPVPVANDEAVSPSLLSAAPASSRVDVVAQALSVLREISAAKQRNRGPTQPPSSSSSSSFSASSMGSQTQPRTVVDFVSSGCLALICKWMVVATTQQYASTNINSTDSGNSGNSSNSIGSDGVDMTPIALHACRILSKLSELQQYVPHLSSNVPLLSSLLACIAHPDSSSATLVRALYLLGNLTLSATPVTEDVTAAVTVKDTSPRTFGSCAEILATVTMPRVNNVGNGDCVSSSSASSHADVSGVGMLAALASTWIAQFVELLRHKSDKSDEHIQAAQSRATLLVKLLRLIANMSLDVRVGVALSQRQLLAKAIVRSVTAVADKISQFPELALNIVASFTNLSFYTPETLSSLGLSPLSLVDTAAVATDIGSGAALSQIQYPSAASSRPYLLHNMPGREVIEPLRDIMKQYLSLSLSSSRPSTVPASSDSSVTDRDSLPDVFASELISEVARALGNATRDPELRLACVTAGGM